MEERVEEGDRPGRQPLELGPGRGEAWQGRPLEELAGEAHVKGITSHFCLVHFYFRFNELHISVSAEILLIAMNVHNINDDFFSSLDRLFI